jgi:hypothetical protein
LSDVSFCSQTFFLKTDACELMTVPSIADVRVRCDHGSGHDVPDVGSRRCGGRLCAAVLFFGNVNQVLVRLWVRAIAAIGWIVAVPLSGRVSDRESLSVLRTSAPTVG